MELRDGRRSVQVITGKRAKCELCGLGALSSGASRSNYRIVSNTSD